MTRDISPGGSTMLALSVVEEVGRLLAEGQLSQRKIAARLGVSRGTVGAIASGRRGLYGKEPPPDDCQSLAHQSPPERCHRCGYVVFMPCLVCRARRYRERQQRLAMHGQDAESRHHGPGFAASPQGALVA